MEASTAAPSAERGDAEASSADGPRGGASRQRLGRRELSVVVVSVIVAGLCSIVYELLIGTVSSYFLGDSITQFSLTIGLFMAAMGLGSFLSRRVGERELELFVAAEVGLGILGGLCVPALFAVYAYTDLYAAAMIVFIVAVGTLTGLEIPLLVLVLRRHYPLRTNLSAVLSLDYLGALAATLLFPFLLLPTLGTFRSSAVVGLANLAVAGLVLKTFRARLAPRRVPLYVSAIVAGAMGLAALLLFSEELLKPWSDAIYEDRVVLVRQTPYQRIVMTRGGQDVRLFLNGNLQFSSVDEYRYHESLIHPAMELAPSRRHVLVLGGGDGLGVREILAHDGVEEVVLVDLDPAMTELARRHSALRELNRDAMRDGRVDVVHADAMSWLTDHPRRWDVIVADLPDPNDTSLARLYSREFYRLVRRRLARGGVFVTQATSPYFARDAFWCIEATLRDAGFEGTLPYHAYVPSFGDWGFVLAAPERALEAEDVRIDVPTRYLDADTVPRLFSFARDVRAPRDITPSTLDEPRVLRYYLSGWRHWD
ncbi:MAG TPA: polyamine aminopropyltransferase [Sandaracinaceae bacterium LLY-WYZ-13_1]|nr:polyamine aminopropyltransferase [Sandaracinaceae bacterium LLY-WYZ-13_1]